MPTFENTTAPLIFAVCKPKEDVRLGTMADAEFAADLSMVLRGDAPAEYRDPALFFVNTYPTRGLKNLLTNVCGRLSRGSSAASIFRLDTSYGGGKTHGLIALIHAARSGNSIAGIEEFVLREDLPSTQVQIAAFDGENADPVNGRAMEAGLRASDAATAGQNERSGPAYGHADAGPFVEVWDLLHLLGLPLAWTEEAFLSFHDRLSKPMPSHEDMEELARMFRTMEEAYGKYSHDEMADRLGVCRLKARRLLRILREEATTDRRGLSADDRQIVLKLLRHTSPVGRLISRNTRELLRHYFKTGQMSTRIADREVEHVFLEMTSGERDAYEQVERYIRDSYSQASVEQRSAVGFVMTIYRKRLASSFYALTQTLAKRRENLLRAAASSSLFTDEDISDDDLADEAVETDEIGEMERASLLLDDRSSVEDLLRQVEVLPEDTKSRALRKVLAGLRDAGYRQVMIFTQFTDTLDFVRSELVKSTDLKVLCFSGRGGEIPVGDGRWSKITREDVRRRFARGEADVLVCTDAAAEGLNFQFCGALVNYDLPWNPMRVEQRIGRIDRLGQQFHKIRIVNLHYEDTVEAAVYKVLRERIKLFGDVVGKLQPILSQIAGQIARAVLSTKTEGSAETIVEDIERGAAEAEQAAFDLDSLLAREPIDEVRVPPLYDLGDLRSVIKEHARLMPEVRIDARSDKEVFYQAAGMDTAARITVSPEYFDDHLEDVELWSPGNPLFPWEHKEPSPQSLLENPFHSL